MIRDNNPGLSRRFDAPNPFRFADFTDEELLNITTTQIRGSKLTIPSFAWRSALVDKVSQLRALPNFGNAGAISTCMQNAITRMKGRRSNQLSIDDINGYDDKVKLQMANPMSILDDLELVGPFKDDMEKLGKCVCVLREQGRPTTEFVQNYVFLGNPGTV